MRFLPIVARELREAARRSGTHWVRMGVAAQAAVAALGAWLISFFNNRVKFGEALFWGLAGVAMIHCVLAGRRSTADCLSKEKREGTMGLLFLTDLKGYDVVIGKLVANSLGGFYGLLAIFPVLAVPLLVGGMTSGELWRMALTLMDTFALTLAVGVFCSAGSREYKEAIGRNFLVLTALVVILPMVGAFVVAGQGPFEPVFFYACPFYAFALCEENAYRASRPEFWTCLAVMHGLSWLFVVRACRLLPYSWQDESAGRPRRLGWWRVFRHAITYGGRPGRTAFRRWALDQNAYFWLAARERFKPLHLWAFFAAAAIWWIIGASLFLESWFSEVSDVTLALLLLGTFKLWVTVEAGQRLATDRELGSMELLLCTPLTVGDYLQGQLLALRRQFLRPMIMLALVVLGLMGLALAQRLNAGWFPWAAAVVMLLADAAALALDGMWTGLTCKTHTRATLATVLRILVLPWVGYLTVVAIAAALRELEYIRSEPFATNTLVSLWLGMGLLADAIFGWRAWRGLHADFREMAMRHYGVRAPRPTRVAVARRRLGWRPLTAAAALTAAVAYIGFRPARPHFPPPVTAVLTQNITTWKAFPGWNGGVFLILPDGSLWRWGQPEGPTFPRAVSPEPFGTNRDWVKVVLVAGQRVFGLRTNGSTWDWGVLPNGYTTNFPVRRSEDNEWKDIAVTPRQRVALGRDGTMWAWGPPVYPFTNMTGRFRNRLPAQVGSATNWASISTVGSCLLGVQSNGTLWAWGNLRGATYQFPTQVCRDTNWVSVSESGEGVTTDGARFDVRMGDILSLPDPSKSAAAIFPPATELALGGQRADWVWTWRSGAAWPVTEGPALRLTADNVLLTWGADPGSPPRPSMMARMQSAKNRMTGAGWRYQPSRVPVGTEPRPLMKLQRSN
ncbi:MAG TPA: hypothetical protein VHB20_09345 [Verrucomicrobiae bacterium]|jgi:hypothetical protein|nr:hypothetical protein [Verrucomicrobiae bacterium]